MTAGPLPTRWRWKLAAWLIVIASSIYGALPYAVPKWCAPQWFPPFGSSFSAEQGTLGGEYFNIAEALSRGRGYSDPFFAESGPTAWMPPLLPTIDAAILTITGRNKEALVWLSIVAQVLVLIWVTNDVIDWATPLLFGFVPVLCIAIVLAGNFYHLFQITHDGWLLLLLAHGCVRMLIQPMSLSTTGGAIRWGVWGGACSLASPALTLAWLVSCWNARRELKLPGIFAAVGIALAIQAPWLLRNAVVFGRFVPVKSNGWFELEQSLRDPDGVLDLTTMVNHPIASQKVKRHYIELGEMAFIDERKAAIWQREPNELLRHWLRQVANRVMAAFLWKMPINERFSAPWYLTWSRVVFAVPCLLVCLALTLGWRPSPERRNVAWFAIAYLTPYLAISFYDRYLIPIAGVTMLMSSEAAIHLIKRLWAAFFRASETPVAN